MSSEDEFDALPDLFQGVDFDAIPNLFQGVDFDAIPNLSQPSRRSESEYSFDDVDPSFLAAVDAIENDAVTNHTNPSPSGGTSAGLSNVSPFETSPNPPPIDSPPPKPSPKKFSVYVEIPPHSPRKRPRTSTSPPTPPNKKGKTKEHPDDKNDGVREVLEGFEDEMTCPICCDIFVAAHLGNPCGHSFCGECGWQWIAKNKRTPTCAVCRSKLIYKAPMIPNFAIDNTVEKHIRALAASGIAEWQPGGSKITEWNTRKETWKKELGKRAKPTSHRRHTAPPAHLVEDGASSSSGSTVLIIHGEEDVDADYTEVPYHQRHAHIRRGHGGSSSPGGSNRRSRRNNWHGRRGG